MPASNTNTVNAAIREKSDEQLVRDLHRVENILLIESFGSDHEAKHQLQVERLELFNELKRRGKLESQKKANHQKQFAISLPPCEYRGCPAHAATHMLGWFLNSSRRWKMSCEAHKNKFGGPAYWISKLEGYEDNDERPLHPLGTPEPEE
jgi:hypothetical protein